MKKFILVMLVVILATAIAFTACSTPVAQSPAPSEAAASETPSASAAQTNTKVTFNQDLLTAPWEAQDVSEAPAYLYYYVNPDQPDASVVLVRNDHNEDKDADLKKELEKTTDTYINQTLKGSMLESEATQPQYFEIDGFPAVTFDVTGKLQEGSTAYIARTIFIATDKGIYSLQLQDSAEHFSETNELFNQLKDSLHVVEE